jgi:hypothetical protein
MNVLLAVIQAGVGGVGITLVVIIFNMWRKGDLIPRAVVEMLGERFQAADAIREAARKEESEQMGLLMRELTDALRNQGSRPRHGRDL